MIVFECIFNMHSSVWSICIIEHFISLHFLWWFSKEIYMDFRLVKIQLCESWQLCQYWVWRTRSFRYLYVNHYIITIWSQIDTFIPLELIILLLVLLLTLVLTHADLLYSKFEVSIIFQLPSSCSDSRFNVNAKTLSGAHGDAFQVLATKT